MFYDYYCISNIINKLAFFRERIILVPTPLVTPENPRSSLTPSSDSAFRAFTFDSNMSQVYFRDPMLLVSGFVSVKKVLVLSTT